MLYDDPEGGMGVGRREAKEGGNICMLTADSLCCSAETNKTLKSNSTPIKKN